MNKFITIASICMVLAILVIAPTAAQDTTECETGFHLFDHEYLATEPVCIPDNPQRVLALEISALEAVLFADKELVGTANWLHDEVPLLMPEVASALEGIADTGYPANLEVALQANPDLILAVDGDIDLEAGSEIAPVIMPIPGLEYDWRLSMEFWSDVLGTQDLYADMIASYDARIAEFKEVLPDNPEISVIGASSYGAYMWLEDTAPGVILSDAGLARPESQAFSGEAAVEHYGTERWILLSEETYDLADADAIFVFTYATADPDARETENAAMEAFKTNVIWNTLSATQEDHVYYVGPYWWRAQTYLLANKVLDDLFINLTDVVPEQTYLDLLPDASEPTSTDVSCDQAQRVIVDATGLSMCISDNPQRIVGLMEADVDALLALGITPVGATNGRGQTTPPRYLNDYLVDVTSVGQFYSPNLEILLELDPDLILFGGFADPAVLEQLNAIAPTVNTVMAGESWQSHFLRVGNILNMSDSAQAFVDAYDARIETVKSKLGENAETSFIVARWSADGPQVMAPMLTFSSGVLLDLGLSPAPEIPELQEGHPHSEPLSLESLQLLDVDWAFIGTLSPEGDAITSLDEALANPLFQSLAVVQNDHVVLIDGSLWTSVGGPLAATMVLDKVESVLTEAQ